MTAMVSFVSAVSIFLSDGDDDDDNGDVDDDGNDVDADEQEISK